MPNRTTKLFHYKVAGFTLDKKRTLQTLLKEALIKIGDPFERLQKVTIDSEPTHRLINQVKEYHPLLCGVLISYKEGVYQNTIKLESGVDEFAVEAMAPAITDPNERREFVRGLLYFGVYQNHIVFAGSASLRKGRLENYLNWLLAERTSLIHPENRIVINDPPRPVNLQYKKLKEVVITSQFEFEEGNESNLLSSQEIKPTGPLWDIVSSVVEILGGAAPRANFQGGISPENLEINLSIRKKGTLKGAANLNTPVVDALANAFRNVENPPLTIYFDDGTYIKGENFKVQKPRSVRSINGIPVNDDVYAKLRDWLQNLIANQSLKVK